MRKPLYLSLTLHPHSPDLLEAALDGLGALLQDGPVFGDFVSDGDYLVVFVLPIDHAAEAQQLMVLLAVSLQLLLVGLADGLVLLLEEGNEGGIGRILREG